MKQIDISEVNFSKIAKLLEVKEEDVVILSDNGKPVLKVTLFEENDKKNLFSCAKEMFTIPDDFDEIDLSADFKQEIFPS